MDVVPRPFGFIVGGGLIVTLGRCCLNYGLEGAFGGHGLDKAHNMGFVAFGGALYLIGWILVMISFGIDTGSTQRVLLLLLGVLIMLASVLLIRERLREKARLLPSSLAMMLLSASWLGVSAVMSFRQRDLTDFRWERALFCFMGSGFILGSLLGIIPKQREILWLDGPGYATYLLGWVLVAMGFSLR